MPSWKTELHSLPLLLRLEVPWRNTPELLQSSMFACTGEVAEEIQNVMIWAAMEGGTGT